MAKCTKCNMVLPLLPNKRSFVEKYITKRDAKKFKCHGCNELQLISPFSSKKANAS